MKKYKYYLVNRKNELIDYKELTPKQAKQDNERAASCYLSCRWIRAYQFASLLRIKDPDGMANVLRQK